VNILTRDTLGDLRGQIEIWTARRLRKLRRASTAAGRHRLRRDAMMRLWPALRVAARLHRQSLAGRTRVVAVVGSLGKGAATAAVRAAMGSSHPPQRSTGFSLLALSVLRIRPTQRHAVLEVGIVGPGMMAPYARMVQPDVVVVTSIASEHHRSFGTLENTSREKSEMLRGLRPGGVAVLNGDDPHVLAMRPAAGDARVVTFGFGQGNDVQALEAKLDWPHGTRLRVRVGGAEREIRSRLLGRVMVYPLLAALAVAWLEGRDMGEAVAALERLPPRPGRLQLLPLPNGAWLIRDDYKSTLETIDAALDVLAEVPGRRIVVIGEVSEPPGSQGPIYRRLGERLAGIASRVVCVCAETTYKSYVVGAARAGMPRSALVHAGRDVRAAWEAVRADLGPGDVVLVKGRDTQRLDRVALALQGRAVGCEIEFCNLKGMRCEVCPMLERGWAGA
jgi:UDP-N-acetylmuramoyl-tripeptide--D-alanyl-D-alanine ligase